MTYYGDTVDSGTGNTGTGNDAPGIWPSIEYLMAHYGDTPREVRVPRIDRRTVTWHKLDTGFYRGVVCEWRSNPLRPEWSDVVRRWHVTGTSLSHVWRQLGDHGVVPATDGDDGAALTFRMLGNVGR